MSNSAVQLYDLTVTCHHSIHLHCLLCRLCRLLHNGAIQRGLRAFRMAWHLQAHSWKISLVQS